jgi:hypothetical protein
MRHAFLIAAVWACAATSGWSAEPAVTSGPAFSYYGTLQFDGVSDHLTVSDRRELRPGRFTLSAWVRSDDVMRMQPMLAKAEAAGNYVSYMLRIQSDGRLSLVVGNAATGADVHWLTQQPLSSGAWHHVAATWENSKGDNTDASIYLDGVDQEIEIIRSVNNGPAFEPGYSKLPLYIGRDEFPSGHFLGAIQSVEIFDRVLTRAEVRELARHKPEAGRAAKSEE